MHAVVLACVAARASSFPIPTAAEMDVRSPAAVALMVSVVERRKAKKHPPAILQYADSHSSADQLYFSGFVVSDPFVTMRVAGKKIGVLGALEWGRALKESTLDEVLALEAWEDRARKKFGSEKAPIAEVIATLARSLRVGRFSVASGFPHGLALRLTELGLSLEPVDGPLFPQREIKSDDEAMAIAAGNRCSAAGIAAAEDQLRRAFVRRGRLFLDGRALTSERLREAVEIACLRAGGVSQGAIAAGGDQACDPHCLGSGPLRAGELIIVDVFPRMTTSGYFGDMTRTFLKGAPSDAQLRLVDTVRKAQREAMKTIKAGVHGLAVHRRVVRFFAAAGYETKRGASGSSGFFHGTGHGLGLEVHERPNLGRSGTRLRKGAVVTVEPGLYYPGLGGCRIEDVVQVETSGVRRLSRFHYRWIVP